MLRAPVLLVDDDIKLLRIVSLKLESEGYQVAAFASASDALTRLPKIAPGLVIADLKMPNLDGLQLLTRLQECRPGLPVILFSAYGDIADAVKAMHAGAIDFLTKPVDWNRLLDLLDRHLDPDVSAAPDSAFGDIVATRSLAMQAVLQDARRVASTTSSVLISGASGTGKEVVARAIHDASPRAAKPFVAINCAAVPSELLESVLFGHKRGAFTGAHTDHQGLFRAAHGGTVFLDEIGDMPVELQAKLLRVLEGRKIRPVGETHSIPIDVRVISATHRDLEQRAEQGSFRQDLFYRLNVVRLNLPDLDERREDIPLLVRQRLTLLDKDAKVQHVFSPEAMNLLRAASWPGNVRQLLNTVEQTVALAPSRVISASLVRRCLGKSVNALTELDEAREAFTRQYLGQLLEAASGNVARAARIAGRNRSDFYRLLARYGLSADDFKNDASSSSA